LGTAVFSGMLGVTLFGIFLTPVFFYVIEGFIEVPLFTSQRARQLGRALRYAALALTLGLPLLPRLLARRRLAPVPPAGRCGRPEAGGANGAAIHPDEAARAPGGEKVVIEVAKLLPTGEAAPPNGRNSEKSEIRMSKSETNSNLKEEIPK